MVEEQNGDLGKNGIAASNEKSTCPECGGSDFIEDTTRGEFTCVVDGVVIRSNVLDDNDVFQGASNIENVGRDLGSQGRDNYAKRNKNRLGSCPYATLNGQINGSASSATRAYHRRLMTIQRNHLAERPTLRRKAQRIIDSDRMPGELSVKDMANRILLETHDLESESRHSSDSALMKKIRETNDGEKPPYPLNQVRHLQALTKKDGDEKTTVRSNKGDSATVAAIAAMAIAARMLGKSFSIERVAKEHGLSRKDIHTEKKNMMGYLKTILSAEMKLNRTISILNFDASRIMGRPRWTESEIVAVIENIGPSMVEIHGLEEGRRLTRLLGDLLRIASRDSGLSGENLRVVAATFCDRMNKYRERRRVFKIISEALNVSRQRVSTVTDKFGGLINRLVVNVIES